MMRSAACLRTCLVTLLLAAGCGDDDPMAYSAPVGINLKAKSGDVKSGVITDEKAITTESGNPYGQFISAARGALGGKDPSRIGVTAITLTLGAASKGVAALQDVFSGKVEIMFVMNDTNNTFNAGTVSGPTGSGPVSLSVTFSDSALNETDLTKLLGGSFKVSMRGATTSGFETKKAEAELIFTFTFEAYR